MYKLIVDKFLEDFHTYNVKLVIFSKGETRILNGRFLSKEEILILPKRYRFRMNSAIITRDITDRSGLVILCESKEV